MHEIVGLLRYQHRHLATSASHKVDEPPPRWEHMRVQLTSSDALLSDVEAVPRASSIAPQQCDISDSCHVRVQGLQAAVITTE
jgi:hypothetical protein